MKFIIGRRDYKYRMHMSYLID